VAGGGPFLASVRSVLLFFRLRADEGTLHTHLDALLQPGIACMGAISSTLQTALALCGFPKPYTRILIVAEQIIDIIQDTILRIWCECFKNGKSVAFLSDL
jgi:hypothetical protein